MNSQPYRCEVQGCHEPGCYGRRRNLADWRKGYRWWCKQHRNQMPRLSPLEKQPAGARTLDKAGQGRLL